MRLTTSSPTETCSHSKANPVFQVLARHGQTFLAAIPVIVLVVFVWRSAVDVPYLDQWEFLPLLDKMYKGHLTLADVWTQCNEHRIFFPNLLMLGLARLTHWNIRAESGASVILAIAIFAVLIIQIRKTARRLHVVVPRWAIAACSICVFSMSQYENWLWGWQVQILLSVLTACSSILLLANGAIHPGRLASALLLAFVATFSFANGVLVWPIGLLLIWLTNPPTNVRNISIAIWAVMGGVSLWLYAHNFQPATKHPSMVSPLARPVLIVSYFLKFLGSVGAQYSDGAVLPDGVLALFFGLSILAALGWAAWTVHRNLPGQPHVIGPYLALSAYGLGTALVTSIARSGFGSNQALASRYCTFTIPLWFSALTLLLLRQSIARRASDSTLPFQPATRRSPANWLAFAFVGVLVLSSAFAIRSANEMSNDLARGRRSLIAQINGTPVKNPHEGFVICFSPETLRARLPVLQTNRLSVCRDSQFSADRQVQ